MANKTVNKAGKKGAAKKPNRVDGLVALDRQTGRGVARGPQRQPNFQPQPRPGVRPAGGGASPGGFVATTPSTFGQLRGPSAGVIGQHPFIPGANLQAVAPAHANEAGSSPGTPNISKLVMQSFQPDQLQRTPLVTSGAGLPGQNTQPNYGATGGPNPNMNFGGAQLPPNQSGFVPSMQPQGGGVAR